MSVLSVASAVSRHLVVRLPYAAYRLWTQF